MSALLTTWAALGGDPGFHVFSFGGETSWLDVTERAAFVRRCESCGWEGDLLLAAVPSMASESARPGRASVLWARCETGKSCELLEAFQPAPTLILAEGGSVRRVALWALSQPLAYGWTERLNRRIAHRLQSPKKHASPWFRFNPPGTILREGRAKPIPVVTVGGSLELYGARQVAGHLPEAPDPNAWRNRHAA